MAAVEVAVVEVEVEVEEEVAEEEVEAEVPHHQSCKQSSQAASGMLKVEPRSRPSGSMIVQIGRIEVAILQTDVPAIAERVYECRRAIAMQNL